MPTLSGAASEEGVVYVSATGTYYAEQDIDAQVLYDILQNGYIEEQVEKIVPQIFNGMYSLSVKGPDGEEDEELTAHLKAMLEAPGVDLWSRMKQSWVDIHEWGPFIFYPQWTKDGAEQILTELRRLPPESFSDMPPGARKVYSDILQGIIVNDAGETEFHQVQEDGGRPVKLRGTRMFIDPTSTKLTGKSRIICLVPIVRMLDMCCDAQMQKVYRVGAPIMFIEITDPAGDDKDYAQQILNNWGKDTMFQLRPNMKAVILDFHDSESAMETIAWLESRIRAHFNPSANMQKAAPSIGGNAAAEKDTNDDWIAGQRTMIEDLWEGLIQEYLRLNSYEGYSVELVIAAKVQSPGELEMNQARTGYDTGCMTINERREKLGLAALSDEEIAQLLDEQAKVKAITAPAPASPFGASLGEMEQRARIVKEISNADPMDPERYMSDRQKMEFLYPKKDSSHGA